MLARFENIMVQVVHCDQFVVALSGGLDSTVLLFLMAKLSPEKTIAVHVDHGLSVNAKKWFASCQQLCDQLGVRLQGEIVDASAQKGESPEDAARTARYNALAKYIDKNSCLLTAHNQDDQCETVFLQAFRGAGPKGLSAMPMLTSFSNGQHFRPVLSFTRAELHEFALANSLSWVEDESNQNINFDRNYIRHELTPIIKKRWPTVSKTISRVAEHCAQAQQLLDEIADYDLSLMQGHYDNSISIKSFLALSVARQNNV